MQNSGIDHVIKVDIDELRGVANMIRSCAQHMEEQQAKLDTMNQVLLGTWSGEARDSYIQMFIVWRKNFQKKIVSVQMIADGFGKVAEGFSTASDQVRALWSGGAVA